MYIYTYGNRNRNMIYYFIVYAELRYSSAKLLPYVKDCTRRRLISVLIYKITWKFVLLKIDFGEFSVLRAYPLQGPTMSCTLIVPRCLDHRATPANQLCSIELPMYAH